MMTTKQRIKNLKNFASLDQSFKEWLANCPRDYIWQIDEVVGKDQATFTFKRPASYRRPRAQLD